MKLSLRVTRHTTASELIILGAFFESLALAREGRISSVSADEPLTAPVDPAELHEPETVVVQAAPAAGEEAPKRRRRTKAEIEADAAKAATPVEPAAETPAPTEPEQAPATETPAPTQPAPQPDTPQSETASTEPASASPSEPVGPVTHAEAQKQAIDAARRHGPEKVKAIIAQYEGAAKIADLKESDLASFIGKLQALAA